MKWWVAALSLCIAVPAAAKPRYPAKRLRPQVEKFFPTAPKGWTAGALHLETFQDPVELAIGEQPGWQADVVWHVVAEQTFAEDGTDRKVVVRFVSLDLAGTSVIDGLYDSEEGKDRIATRPELDYIEYASYRGVARQTKHGAQSIGLQIESTATLEVSVEGGPPQRMATTFLEAVDFSQMKSFLDDLVP